MAAISKITLKFQFKGLETMPNIAFTPSAETRAPKMQKFLQKFSGAKNETAEITIAQK